MTPRPYPSFPEPPKNPTAFLRAVLPAILDQGPATSVEILQKASHVLQTHYAATSWRRNVELTPKTVATVLAPPRGKDPDPSPFEALKEPGSRVVRYRNAGLEAPPVPVREQPAPSFARAEPDAPGLCQATGTLWQEPPAKCVWGVCAPLSKHERSFLVEAIKAAVPDLHGPISASRIRRQAIVINPGVRQLSRANVAAILLLLAREGFSSLIARHNPKRKRRVLYLWHRAVS